MRSARMGLFLVLPAISWAQVRLELDRPVSGRIEADRAGSYTLDLKAGEYVEILAEQTSVNVLLRLIGPDGKQIQEVDHLGIGGTELLIHLAEREGASLVSSW